MPAGPVLEYIETKMYKREDGLWAVRNWLFRTSLRTLYVVLLTLVGRHSLNLALVPSSDEGLPLLLADKLCALQLPYSLISETSLVSTLFPALPSLLSFLRHRELPEDWHTAEQFLKQA